MIVFTIRTNRRTYPDFRFVLLQWSSIYKLLITYLAQLKSSDLRNERAITMDFSCNRKLVTYARLLRFCAMLHVISDKKPGRSICEEDYHAKQWGTCANRSWLSSNWSLSIWLRSAFWLLLLEQRRLCFWAPFKNAWILLNALTPKFKKWSCR